MNIIAVLLIIALIALILSIALLVVSVLAYIRLGKRAARIVQRQLSAMLHIYNTGLGIATGAFSRSASAKYKIATAAGRMNTVNRGLETIARDLAIELVRLASKVEEIVAGATVAKQAMDIFSQFNDVLRKIRT